MRLYSALGLLILLVAATYSGKSMLYNWQAIVQIKYGFPLHLPPAPLAAQAPSCFSSSPFSPPPPALPACSPCKPSRLPAFPHAPRVLLYPTLPFVPTIPFPAHPLFYSPVRQLVTSAGRPVAIIWRRIGIVGVRWGSL